MDDTAGFMAMINSNHQQSHVPLASTSCGDDGSWVTRHQPPATGSYPLHWSQLHEQYKVWSTEKGSTDVPGVDAGFMILGVVVVIVFDHVFVAHDFLNHRLLVLLCLMVVWLVFPFWLQE